MAHAERYIDVQATARKRKNAAILWRNPLRKWVYPVIGDVEIGDIRLSHVVAALSVAWQEVPETARRMRARIERIFDAAIADGLYERANPAAMRLVGTQLPRRKRVIAHFRAAKLEDAPVLYRRIAKAQGTAYRALQFMILTTVRPSEALKAMWSEVNVSKKIWTVPAIRTKGSREHPVPFSDAAMDVLAAQAAVRVNDFIFPGQSANARSRTIRLRRPSSRSASPRRRPTRFARSGATGAATLRMFREPRRGPARSLARQHRGRIQKAQRDREEARGPRQLCGMALGLGRGQRGRVREGGLTKMSGYAKPAWRSAKSAEAFVRELDEDDPGFHNALDLLLAVDLRLSEKDADEARKSRRDCLVAVFSDALRYAQSVHSHVDYLTHRVKETEQLLHCLDFVEAWIKAFNNPQFTHRYNPSLEEEEQTVNKGFTVEQWIAELKAQKEPVTYVRYDPANPDPHYIYRDEYAPLFERLRKGPSTSCALRARRRRWPARRTKTGATTIPADVTALWRPSPLERRRRQSHALSRVGARRATRMRGG
jgi:integrase